MKTNYYTYCTVWIVYAGYSVKSYNNIINYLRTFYFFVDRKYHVYKLTIFKRKVKTPVKSMTRYYGVSDVTHNITIIQYYRVPRGGTPLYQRTIESERHWSNVGLCRRFRSDETAGDPCVRYSGACPYRPPTISVKNTSLSTLGLILCPDVHLKGQRSCWQQLFRTVTTVAYHSHC